MKTYGDSQFVATFDTIFLMTVNGALLVRRNAVRFYHVSVHAMSSLRRLSAIVSGLLLSVLTANSVADELKSPFADETANMLQLRQMRPPQSRFQKETS